MINEQDKQHIEYGWNHNYDLIKDIQQKVINMGNPGLDMETVDDLLTVIRYKDLERSEKMIKELLPLAETGSAYYRQSPGFDWVDFKKKFVEVVMKAVTLKSRLRELQRSPRR
jgi:hypothetical protein